MPRASGLGPSPALSLGGAGEAGEAVRLVRLQGRSLAEAEGEGEGGGEPEGEGEGEEVHIDSERKGFPSDLKKKDELFLGGVSGAIR